MLKERRDGLLASVTEQRLHVAGRTCEDDGVEAGFAPKLHEVNHVPKAKRRVACEYDARLPELTAEVSVNAGIVLQLIGLNQLHNQNSVSCES